VTARRDRVDRAGLAAQHARLVRQLQQYGEHPVHEQLGGIVRDRVRKPTEQGDMLHVRALAGVDQVQQLPAESGQPLG
jgi:hypothetical protein